MTAKSVLMRSGARAPTGVARGYPALWSKNIFASLPTKTTEFEVKNRRGRNKISRRRPMVERCSDFTAFFQKMRIFRHILVYISA